MKINSNIDDYYVNIFLESKKDTSISYSTSTSPDGKFKLLNIKAGTYDLKAGSLYITDTTLISDLEIIGNNNLDLGTFYLNQNGFILENIEIKATRPLIITKSDRYIANISTSQFKENYKAIEILKYLPNVNSNVSGGVTINQSSNILILIDGIGNTHSNQEKLTILREMESSLIEKIEVYTIAPAKYDSEVSSVIDIITKKEKKTSSISTSTGQGFAQNNHSDPSNYSTSTNLNYNFGRLSLFSLFTLNHGENHQSLSEIQYLPQFNRRSQTNFSTENKFFNFNIGLIYQFSPKEKLVGQVNNYFNVFGDQTSLRSSVNVIESSSIDEEKITSSELDERDFHSTSANIGFWSNRNNKMHYDIQLQFNNKANNGFGTYSQSVKTGSYILESINKVELNQIALLGNGETEIGSHKLEFGMKYNNLSYLQDFQSNSISNNSLFNYDENIIGLYAGINFATNKLIGTVSLRTEYTDWSTLNLLESERLSRNNNYFSVFPNAFISFPVNKSDKITIKYGRTIKRPTFSELNSAIIILDNFTVRTGNPNTLEPVFKNTFEIGWNNPNINLSIYSHLLENQRVFIPIEIDGLTNTLQAISINHELNFGINARKRIRVSNKFSITNNLSAYYKTQNGLDGINRGGYGFDYFVSTDYKIKQKMNANISFSYYVAPEYGYFYSSDIPSLDISFRSTKGSFSYSVGVNDVLGINKIDFFKEYENFRSQSYLLSNRRSIFLRMTYQFKMGNQFSNKRFDRNENGVRF